MSLDQPIIPGGVFAVLTDVLSDIGSALGNAGVGIVGGAANAIGGAATSVAGGIGASLGGSNAGGVEASAPAMAMEPSRSVEAPAVQVGACEFDPRDLCELASPVFGSKGSSSSIGIG